MILIENEKYSLNDLVKECNDLFDKVNIINTDIKKCI